MRQPHEGSAPHARVEEWKRKSPLRITRARAGVATVLLNHEHPLGAEQIFRQLLASGEDVSLGSVYRILKQMEDDGLVQRERQVSSGGAKAVYTIPGDAPHSRVYVFQCDVCQRRQRISDATLAGQLASVAAVEGYTLPAEIVIPARCRTCTPD
jgi:Fur family ferric uptake transcriptional regulator